MLQDILHCRTYIVQSIVINTMMSKESRIYSENHLYSGTFDQIKNMNAKSLFCLLTSEQAMYLLSILLDGHCVIASPCGNVGGVVPDQLHPPRLPGDGVRPPLPPVTDDGRYVPQSRCSP